MSKKNAQASRTERAAEAMRQQQRQEARRRNLMIGGVVGLLVVLVGLGIVWMAASDDSDDIAAPAAGSAYGLTIGDSDEHEVVVYEDFFCVHCADLEEASADDLQRLAEEGKVTVEYRPIAFLGDYSVRAANAFKVVLDEAGPEAAQKFHNLVFERYEDAAQSRDGLDDDTLVELAVEAGADEADVRPGIEDLAAANWVEEASKAASDAGVQGTPTVLLDGKRVEGTTEDIADSLRESLQ